MTKTRHKANDNALSGSGGFWYMRKYTYICAYDRHLAVIIPQYH